MRLLLLLPLAISCTTAESGDAPAAPGANDGADSGGAVEPDPVVPWGLSLAEDHDPDPNVVEVHLTADEGEVEWVSGRSTEVWTYNGLVPGPLIQLTVGDTLRVVFENQLDEASTIHWHGLRIDDEMDGVPAIQDPVQPGETFTYEFVVPDSGTFWYHPHVRANEQIEHGLQGMLIVREAEEPVAAERVEERAFVVDDVSLNSAGSYGSFNANHMEQMHGRLGNHLLVNGENRVLDGTMRPGVPERWRIVNTANARMMSVEVEGAAWRVIAIDGALLPTPLELDRFRMPVGRRVDVEVLPQAGDTDVSLKILTGGERYPLFSATVEGEAGAGDWAVWPAEPLPEIQDTTQTVTLDLNGENTETGLEWTINGAVWGDHVPMEIDANTPTRIEITDLSGAEHPFHLHGQFFQVVSRNGRLDEWDGGLLDTVLVGGDDELVLYTAFENPGRWMAHCHILEHAELGMMTQMVVE